MQKLAFTSLFLFLFLFSPGYAQIEIEFEDEMTADPDSRVTLDESMSLNSRASVSEIDENMAKGNQPALLLTLEISDNKLTEKVWKDFMKDYGGKTKRAKGGSGENLTSEAEVVGINGVNPLGIYSKASTEGEQNTTMIVWFDLGDDFLDRSNRAAYNEAEAMLLKFAHQVKVEHTRLELKGAEKKLKELKNNLNRLERQNDGYHKDIEDAEKRIAQAEENIVKNNEQQADTSKKIDLQKMLAEEIERRLEELRKQ